MRFKQTISKINIYLYNVIVVKYIGGIYKSF